MADGGNVTETLSFDRESRANGGFDAVMPNS